MCASQNARMEVFMTFVAIAIFVWFLMKSISFSIYEINISKNKVGGIVCIVLSVISFVGAMWGLFLV